MSLVAVASNPFERYKGIGKPEEKKERKEVPLPANLEEVLKTYERTLKMEIYGSGIDLFKHVDQKLTPDEINQFLQLSVGYDAHENYVEMTGQFIGKLIHNSYLEGHNVFALNTTAVTELYGLGSKMEGKAGNPIRINVTGNIEFFGDKTKYVVLNINGNAGPNLGILAEDSEFTVTGNTGLGCGYGSRHSKFRISGNVGKICGQYAKVSDFVILGNVGDHCGQESYMSSFSIHGNAEKYCGIGALQSTFELHGNFGRHIGISGGAQRSQSTFGVFTREKFERLKRMISRGSGHKICLKDESGRILEEMAI